MQTQMYIDMGAPFADDSQTVAPLLRATHVEA